MPPSQNRDYMGEGCLKMKSTLTARAAVVAMMAGIVSARRQQQPSLHSRSR